MVKHIQVTKRNGEKEDFDIIKVKKSIAHACEGTSVNPLELESRIDYFVKNGIKTKDIQANIIQHALQLASPQNPEWLMVAGHAYAMDEYHSFLQTGGGNFKQWVKNACSKGIWSKDLLKFYSDDDLDTIASFIKYERDLDHSYASLLTATQKYLAKGEINQILHIGNAMRFGQAEPKETRIQFVKDTYDTLSKREFSLATPFMLNLRSGGNTASCFIVAVEDDLSSIFDNVKRVAEISKNGGGIGIFLGHIRAKGSSVNGNPNAAGTIVQWVKIFNDTLVAVNQGGKRAGAGTVALPVWHNDLFDFLNMQTEHGDIRTKAYDVFPQVTVPDIFMERDKQQGKWVTFCPFEVKQKLGIDVRGKYGKDFEEIYLKIEEAVLAGKLKIATVYENARDITKQIMRVHFENGLPYISFIDRVNEYNPNKNDPEGLGIPCANLCVAPWTKILTDAGYITIGDHEGEKVNVWNGEEYSEVEIVKTGVNQKLVKVRTNKGHELECTPYHKFYVVKNDDVIEVRAGELQQGDVLIDLTMPEGVDGSYTNLEVSDVIDEGVFADTYCFTEPKRHLGVFNGLLTGQCTESYSNVVADVYGHVCNLGSINLGNIKNMKQLAKVSRLACRILNRGVDLTKNPNEITEAHNTRYRTIGIGVMGLHDYLAREFKTFDDHELISDIFEAIEYNAALESVQLAKETGKTFDAFDHSGWKDGTMTARFASYNGKQDWDALQKLIDVHGIYNSQLTSPAPTTSTSIYQDASASIQPVFGTFFAEDNKNGLLKSAARFLKDNPLGYMKTQPQFDAKEVIDFVAEIQKWTDTGVSMELMFDQNKPGFKAKDLYDAIHHAYDKRLKTIYYIRTVKERTEEACASCSG